MTDCLFCKVIRGEIPATVVKQDEHYLAFRDIHPQAPSHVLVIPRQHIRSLNEVTDPGVVGGLMLFARDVARAEGLAEAGFRVVLNTNGDGGQTVFHIHAHVLGGRAMKWPPG
jgi:histidine triad (HIT) family protein